MAHISKIVSLNNLKNPTEARDRILRGVNLICDATKMTLGPHGVNFLLEKGLKTTNDGITIAKEIQTKDEIEDLGVRFAREAAVKTNDLAGDGTTTALVLTQAILKAAIQTKKSVLQIRKQIIDECTQVIEKLKALAMPVDSKQKLTEIAYVSSEDQGLANLIASTQWDLGPDGMILVEESNDREDSIERIPGIRIDNGLGMTNVINNQEKQRLEINNVQVILTNHTFQTLDPILETLQGLVNAGKRDIVIVARAYTPEAIQQCHINITERNIRIYPINAPYVDQREVMKDLASVLGGRYIDSEESSLESLSIKDIGFAKRVEAYRYSAILTGDKNEQSETRISKRIEELTKKLEGEQSAFMQKNIRTRISQLKDGCAMLKVGALSEKDRKYRFDKAEDCINATRAALQEGTIQGGGLALKQISDQMVDDTILKQPLLAPHQQIMANAGQDFLIEDYVRDPVKVTRIALENACQIAAQLATAGGSIASERSKPKLIEFEEK